MIRLLIILAGLGFLTAAWFAPTWAELISEGLTGVAFLAVAFVLYFNKPKRLRSPKVTKWNDINSESDLLGALGDVANSQYGGTGQNVGYRITDRARKDMKNWDEEYKRRVRLLFERKFERIDLGKLTLNDLEEEKRNVQ